jgi:putative NADH-flavin reductase
MQVTILGASGRIGSLALAAGLAAGHDVVILSRRPPDDLRSAPTHVVIGGITDADAVRRAIAGSAAVIAAVGPRHNTAEDERALETGMHNVTRAMAEFGVTRLVALSGAAIDVAGDAKPLVDRAVSRIVRLAARHVVAAKQREFEVMAASDLDWTALRPPIVIDGDARGYRLTARMSPGARVTRADVAAALVDQLIDSAFVQRAPFVLGRWAQDRLIGPVRSSAPTLRPADDPLREDANRPAEDQGVHRVERVPIG